MNYACVCLVNGETMNGSYGAPVIWLEAYGKLSEWLLDDEPHMGIALRPQ